MLETEVGHMIAEGEQEVIVAIVPRAKELARFGDQVGHALLNLGADGERGFAVGDQIEFVVDRLAGRRDVDGAIVLAGDDRRIDEEFERDGLEGNVVAGLACRSGSEVPNFQPSGRISLASIGDLRRRRAGRIEDDLVPFEDDELVGGRVAFGLDEVVSRRRAALRRRERRGGRQKTSSEVALPGNDLYRPPRT